MTDSSFTVSEFNEKIESLLTEGLGYAWVKGEVTNLKEQWSGHTYFSLKDATSQVNSVLFKGDKLRQATRLAEGMEVLLYGKVSVYSPRGSYQIIAKQVIESGDGGLQKQLQILKEKLQADGVFEEKRPLKEYIEKIGIITSPSGAALQDVLSVLERKQWTGKIDIIGIKVQGEECEKSLLSAIEEAKGKYDLLMITRGGGSLEDLMGFNAESVARAIKSSNTLILSAVGHEIDTTFCDLAADIRAETPSSGAEMIAEHNRSFQDRLYSYKESLIYYAEKKILLLKSVLQSKEKTLLKQEPENKLFIEKMKLNELIQGLISSSEVIINKNKNILMHQSYGINKATLYNYLETRKSALKTLQNQLNSLNIKTQLEKGFSIVKKENEVIKSSKILKAGERITLQFIDGEQIAIIK